jgi:peptide/nickel transport system substrate-binding protein
VLTQDVRVRQALNYAVDKQAIADKLYAGYASPLKCSTVPPQAFGHNPDLSAYPYDPEKAKQLLEEAGAVGKTVTFVSTPDRWLKAREVSQTVAAYIEAAGLKVKLNLENFDKYLEDITAKRNKPPLLYHSSSNDLLDADRQISTYYDSSSGLAAYKNPRVDELAKSARSEADADKRTGMYHELLKTGCDDAAFIFLVNVEDTFGASKRLKWTPRADQKILARDMQIGD